MKNTNVVNLSTAEDESDEHFAEFIETLRQGNESAVFLISRKDGSLTVGSTAQNAKDLLWDCERLRRFMQAVIDGDVE